MSIRVHRAPGFTVHWSWTKAISSPTCSNLHGASENINIFRVPRAGWDPGPHLVIATKAGHFFPFTRLVQLDDRENAEETRLGKPGHQSHSVIDGDRLSQCCCSLTATRSHDLLWYVSLTLAFPFLIVDEGNISPRDRLSQGRFCNARTTWIQQFQP